VSAKKPVLGVENRITVVPAVIVARRGPLAGRA
jgi:hypothetical protein